MEHEIIVWEGKPSWLDYPVELLLAVVFLPLMGIGLLLLGLVAVKRALCEYKITTQRTISKTGLFNSKRAEVEVEDIRNLNVKQDLWQRLCGIGTVEISSAGGSGIEVMFVGVSNPEDVKEKIRALRKKNNGKK